MLLKNKLTNKDFIITAELTPPKGTDCKTMFQVAQDLKGKVDAVNVTDSPMAKMKMSSIMAGHFIQEETGLEVIPHVTCRDKNIIALQGELLGASKLGINNILAITGDDPTQGDHPQASPVFDTNSIGVIDTVQKLNQGADTNDNQLTGVTDLTVATAGNLGADDLDEEIERLETKVAAGADFIQTQPAYDFELLEEFLTKTNHLEVPILIGVLPLTSYKMAQYLDGNVPGVEIPSSVLEQMKGQGVKKGVEISNQFLQEAYDLIEGIHIMSANRSDILLDILTEIT
ncbi:methylenetetrahydrofolate reductase [Halanaerobaculum tunisiense]